MSPRCRRSRNGRKRSTATGPRNLLLLAFPEWPTGAPVRRRRRLERLTMMSNSYVNTFLFGIYPYLCLSILLIGSLIRFDREPYTWKSDSSQMLHKRELRLGSNLFHYGVIIVILGHFAGFLAPHWAVDWALSPVAHQLLAMVIGGIAGVTAIVGLSILIHRRLADPRIRLNSRKWDIAITFMLWLQLLLGLLTVPFSAYHMDGG